MSERAKQPGGAQHLRRLPADVVERIHREQTERDALAKHQALKAAQERDAFEPQPVEEYFREWWT